MVIINFLLRIVRIFIKKEEEEEEGPCVCVGRWDSEHSHVHAVEIVLFGFCCAQKYIELMAVDCLTVMDFI